MMTANFPPVAPIKVFFFFVNGLQLTSGIWSDLPFQRETELPWRFRWPDGPSKKGWIGSKFLHSEKLRWWDQDVWLVHICGENVGERRGCGKNEQADVGIQTRREYCTYCTRRHSGSVLPCGVANIIIQLCTSNTSQWHFSEKVCETNI